MVWRCCSGGRTHEQLKVQHTLVKDEANTERSGYLGSNEWPDLLNSAEVVGEVP